MSRVPNQRLRGIEEYFVLAVASGAGAGYCPIAPGTAGTLVGIPLYLALSAQPKWLFLLTLAAFLALGVWASDRVEALLDQKDPPVVVIDEILGFLVTMAWIEPGAFSLAAGFVLFRFFDIAKIPPARLAEKKLPGGLGVVLDDIVAALYAHICLLVALKIAPFL